MDRSLADEERLLSPCLEGLTTVHQCPHCGSEHTHHSGVDVYARVQEDAEGYHAKVDRTGVRVDSNLSGNPSSRRDGLVVHLWCEMCYYTHDLLIRQHKGQTLLSVTNIHEGAGEE